MDLYDASDLRGFRRISPTSAAEGRRLGSWDVGGDIHPLVIPTFKHRFIGFPWDWYVYLPIHEWSIFYGKLAGKHTMHWCYGLVVPPSTNSSGGKAIEQYMLIHQVRGFVSLSLSLPLCLPLCIYIYRYIIIYMYIIYTAWKSSQKETIVFQPSISRCYSHACFKGVYINLKSIQALLFISNQHLWTLWHQKNTENLCDIMIHPNSPTAEVFFCPLYKPHTHTYPVG